MERQYFMVCVRIVIAASLVIIDKWVVCKHKLWWLIIHTDWQYSAFSKTLMCSACVYYTCCEVAWHDYK